MDKLFRDAIIINVALLTVFILLDVVTWNDAGLNLDSRIKAIVAANENVIGTYSSYAIVQVGITVRYVVPGYFMNPQDYVGSSINLPLIWFIVTIIVNLYMIWYSGIKRLSELTKSSKTETISPSEQKTN